MAYEGFEAREHFAEDDQVAIVIRARQSGRPFGSEIVGIYTFRSGRITRVRNYYDTASYAPALHRAHG